MRSYGAVRLRFPALAPGPDSLKADSLVILTYWLAVDEPRGAAFFEKAVLPTEEEKTDQEPEHKKGTFLRR